MTIKEAAAQYGVSKQAIYQRLKKAGKDLDQIRDAKTGELTEVGRELVNSIYGQNADKGASTVKHDDLQVERMKAEIEALRAENKALNAQLDAARDERDYLRQALDREQQLHGMTLSRLPAPDQPRQGIIYRLAAHFKREKA